jgi:hypothetical protein
MISIAYRECNGAIMRVYKNAWFAKFADRERIADAALCEVVARTELGLIDANLGGGLLKQRVARPGEGKSGGYRTLIFFRFEESAVFAFGFAKKDQANLNDRELVEFKRAAKEFLAFDQVQIDALVEIGRLTEVICEQEDVSERGHGGGPSDDGGSL